MAETYSLTVTGAPAQQTFAVASLQVGDSVGPGVLHPRAMQLNTQILCKNADGSQTWYTVDAERSLPGALVMKAVGP